MHERQLLEQRAQDVEHIYLCAALPALDESERTADQADDMSQTSMSYIKVSHYLCTSKTRQIKCLLIRVYMFKVETLLHFDRMSKTWLTHVIPLEQ